VSRSGAADPPVRAAAVLCAPMFSSGSSTVRCPDFRARRPARGRTGGASGVATPPPKDLWARGCARAWVPFARRSRNCGFEARISSHYVPFSKSYARASIGHSPRSSPALCLCGSEGRVTASTKSIIGALRFSRCLPDSRYLIRRRPLQSPTPSIPTRLCRPLASSKFCSHTIFSDPRRTATPTIPKSTLLFSSAHSAAV
jgi:hypothetical protein